VVQIASGLTAAHGEQVVHGDLKPANVIVRDDGNAVILDFGLAGRQHVSEDASEEPHSSAPEPSGATL
jgi:serine/threonine protein kinase